MKFKKLAVITDCVHMYDADGNVATENHIFQKQLAALCSAFEQAMICCPFTSYTPDKVTSVYKETNIIFHPLPNVGGNNFKDKIKLIITLPAWLRAFSKANKFADIIYQRFPNNLNIPGIIYFYLKRSKVFATYTGTWDDYMNEPSTYRLQKRWLQKIFRGPVFIYTARQAADKKFIPNFSPSFTQREWDEETSQVAERITKLEKETLLSPVFISVGSLQQNKNQQFILEVFNILHRQNLNFKLSIVGDGPLKESYQQFINSNDLDEKIVLAGKKTYDELKVMYREADFLIQAPLAEGFGKVPMEGFCHGVIPLLSNTALADEMTGNGSRGVVFTVDNAGKVATLIQQVLNGQYNLSKMVIEGRRYARQYTIERWVDIFRTTINNYYES